MTTTAALPSNLTDSDRRRLRWLAQQPFRGEAPASLLVEKLSARPGLTEIVVSAIGHHWVVLTDAGRDAVCQEIGDGPM
jgi:DNA-binding transcriptional ArsR family regulator